MLKEYPIYMGAVLVIGLFILVLEVVSLYFAFKTGIYVAMILGGLVLASLIFVGVIFTRARNPDCTLRSLVCRWCDCRCEK